MKKTLQSFNSTLKRKTGLKATKPINKVSDKHKIELKHRANLKSELIDKGHVCHDCGATNLHLDLHHVKHVSQGGKTTKDNCILLCRACHQNRHLHPGLEAPARGKALERD